MVARGRYVIIPLEKKKLFRREREESEITQIIIYQMEIQDEAAQREDVQRRLKLASILCFTFLAVEVVGGLISGSLAVLSDAAHLSSDLMSFLFALAAGRLASMPGSKDYVSLSLMCVLFF